MESYQDNFNKKLNFATNPYGKLLKSTHLIFLDPLSNNMISPNWNSNRKFLSIVLFCNK